MPFTNPTLQSIVNLMARVQGLSSSSASHHPLPTASNDNDEHANTIHEEHEIGLQDGEGTTMLSSEMDELITMAIEADQPAYSHEPTVIDGTAANRRKLNEQQGTAPTAATKTVSYDADPKPPKPKRSGRGRPPKEKNVTSNNNKELASMAGELQLGDMSILAKSVPLPSPANSNGIEVVRVSPCVVVPLVPKLHGERSRLVEQLVPIVGQMPAASRSQHTASHDNGEATEHRLQIGLRNHRRTFRSTFPPGAVPEDHQQQSTTEAITFTPALRKTHTPQHTDWTNAMLIANQLMPATEDDKNTMKPVGARKTRSSLPVPHLPRGHRIFEKQQWRSALVEWVDGSVGCVNETSGIDAEHHSRETHYLNLLPTPAEIEENQSKMVELMDRPLVVVKSGGDDDSIKQEAVDDDPAGQPLSSKSQFIPSPCVEDAHPRFAQHVAARDVRERSRLQLARLRDTFTTVGATKNSPGLSAKTKRQEEQETDTSDVTDALSAKRKKVEESHVMNLSAEEGLCPVGSLRQAPLAHAFVSAARPRMQLYGVGHQLNTSATPASSNNTPSTENKESRQFPKTPTSTTGKPFLASKALVGVGSAQLEFLLHFEGFPHHNRYCTITQIIELFEERAEYDASRNQQSSVNNKPTLPNRKGINALPLEFRKQLVAVAVATLQEMLREFVQKMLVVMRCKRRYGNLKAVHSPQVLEAIVWYEQQQTVTEFLEDLKRHGLLHSAVKEVDLMPHKFWDGMLPQWEEARLYVLNNGRVATHAELMSGMMLNSSGV